MPHTVEELTRAAGEHAALSAFLTNAHTGTADLIVGARAGGRGREAQLSVPQGIARPVIDWAVDRVRKLEIEYGIEPWAKPKGDPTPAKKSTKKKTG